MFINSFCDTVWIIGWTICHVAGRVPNFSFVRWQLKKTHTITSLMSVPPIQLQEYVIPTITAAAPQKKIRMVISLKQKEILDFLIRIF